MKNKNMIGTIMSLAPMLINTVTSLVKDKKARKALNSEGVSNVVENLINKDETDCK